MEYEAEIDYERTVVCPDCNRKFHPSGDNEKFCLRCLAQWSATQRERDDWYDGECDGECDGD